MSTRCQVKVVQRNLDWNEEVTLYHHMDGYPDNIIPLIAEAYNTYGQGWDGGRAGKVASFLCAVDPGQFEPEEGHYFHSDIEYFYELQLMNNNKGSMAENPTWIVDVYEPIEGFWDNSDRKHLKKINTYTITKDFKFED